MHWWVTDYVQDGLYVLLISHIFWSIFSVTLHELAHGWTAIWQGDDTPRRLGHMTGNPIVHMGPMSLVMFAVLGIAWGQMPIDPSRFRWKRRGRLVVAGAGPAMNLLLCLLSLTAMTVLTMQTAASPSDGFAHNLTQFLWVGGWLNLTLAIWNLMPLWPLDGAQMLMGTTIGWYRFFNDEKVQTVTQFIYFALFISGVGGFAFMLAQHASNAYVAWLLGILGHSVP